MHSKLVILSTNRKRYNDLGGFMYVEQLRLTRSFAFSRVWGSDEEHDLHVHDCLEIGVLLEHELEYRFG